MQLAPVAAAVSVGLFAAFAVRVALWAVAVLFVRVAPVVAAVSVEQPAASAVRVALWAVVRQQLRHYFVAPC